MNSPDPVVSRITGKPAIITFTRSGDTQSPLLVNYAVSGTAVGGQDFQLSPTDTGTTLSIPAGSSSAELKVLPVISTNFVGGLALHFSIEPKPSYAVASPGKVDISIGGNTVPATVRTSTAGAILTWSSSSTKQYHVAYKNKLTDPGWTLIGQVTATNSTSSWVDGSLAATSQRFYLVAQVD
jgi:hypothetical protein